MLTGPTASGKTSTAWALFANFEKIVFLEHDLLVFRKPRDPETIDDLHLTYDQLALNIEFHVRRGVSDYVVTISPRMVSIFSDVSDRFSNLAGPIYPFRLHCECETSKRRIFMRNRGKEQQQRELGWIIEDAELLEQRFSDDSEFVRIDTSLIDEEAVAAEILRQIREQNESSDVGQRSLRS